MVAHDDQLDVQGSEGTVYSYEQKVQFACPIAHPMASEKLAKRLFKLARKARRCKKADSGIKSIVKAIEKKNASGIVLLAGDISPIDTITHIPIICEEHHVPYCYVASKVDLGASTSSVGPLPATFILRDDEYGDLYDKCYSAVDALPLPI
ncbi:hypothetical protein P879_02903 [Paragonimus westermani]|uniref:H/ACA ribonucleoprotein complex subunit 2 n=1 Tax=Paragonimus westermani TaxID=34504 RepID=A0A8T0DK53_9TREM|nr:hypothetical protein P879_02903 [Paragonimus westermani]